MIVEHFSVKRPLAATLAFALGLSFPAGAAAQVVNSHISPVALSGYSAALSAAAIESSSLVVPTMAITPSISAMSAAAAPALVSAPAALIAPTAIAAPAAIAAHPAAAPAASAMGQVAGAVPADRGAQAFDGMKPASDVAALPAADAGTDRRSWALLKLTSVQRGNKGDILVRGELGGFLPTIQYLNSQGRFIITINREQRSMTRREIEYLQVSLIDYTKDHPQDQALVNELIGRTSDVLRIPGPVAARVVQVSDVAKPASDAVASPAAGVDKVLLSQLNAFLASRSPRYLPSDRTDAFGAKHAISKINTRLLAYRLTISGQVPATALRQRTEIAVRQDTGEILWARKTTYRNETDLSAWKSIPLDQAAKTAATEIGAWVELYRQLNTAGGPRPVSAVQVQASVDQADVIAGPHPIVAVGPETKARILGVFNGLKAQNFPGVRWRAKEPRGSRYVRIALAGDKFADNYRYDALILTGPFASNAPAQDPNKAEYFIIVRSGGQIGASFYSSPISIKTGKAVAVSYPLSARRRT